MTIYQELQKKLYAYNDIDTAIAVYREAHVIEQNMKDLKKECLAIGQSYMEEDGVQQHRSITGGSAGWTNPKAKKLDEKRWNKLLESDPAVKLLNEQLASLESTVKAIKQQIQEIQEESGCMVLNEPKFYIKT